MLASAKNLATLWVEYNTETSIKASPVDCIPWNAAVSRKEVSWLSNLLDGYLTSLVSRFHNLVIPRNVNWVTAPKKVWERTSQEFRVTEIN